MILRVRRPLYGVPEARLHWFRTYHRFHIDTLNLKTPSHDMRLLFARGAVTEHEKEILRV